MIQQSSTRLLSAFQMPPRGPYPDFCRIEEHGNLRTDENMRVKTRKPKSASVVWELMHIVAPSWGPRTRCYSNTNIKRKSSTAPDIPSEINEQRVQMNRKNSTRADLRRIQKRIDLSSQWKTRTRKEIRERSIPRNLTTDRWERYSNTRIIPSSHQKRQSTCCEGVVLTFDLDHTWFKSLNYLL